MEPNELSARLRFLSASAHLLSTTSPATSRHIMSRHNALMFDSKLELSEAQTRDACGACGAIMILGWEATLEQETQNFKKAKKKPRVGTTQPRSMVYSCRACSRKTRIPSGTAKPPGRHGKSLPIPSSAPIPISTSIASSTNTSTISKKRPRPKKGGLAAILAKNQASQPISSGFGLDLMDFMKKG